MAFSNLQVAHRWASGNARPASGYSMQFDGASLYSWGSHYLLGYRVADGLFFLNSRRVSNSTSKHQSIARRAAHGEVFTLPDLTAVRDELHAIARFHTKGETIYFADVRDALKRVVATFADDARHNPRTYDALKRLATMAGLSPIKATDTIAAAMKAERVKEEKRNKAHAAKLRADALAYARIPAAEFDSRLAARAAELRNGSREAESRLSHEKIAATLHHRNATKAGLAPATVRKIWNRVKALRAILAEHEAKRERREGRVMIRTLIAELRQSAKPVRTERAATNAGERGRYWHELQSAAYRLANTRIAAVPAATRARLAELSKLADAERGKAQADASREIVERQREAFEAWQRGDSGSRYYGPSPFGGAAIRATHVERDAAGEVTGGTLETSQGASVPLVHAIKAFRFVKMCREAGREWHRNGRTVRVGFYQIDSISAAGDFKAGCHEFKWPEIERLARELGVLWASASDSAVEPSAHAA